MISRCECHDVEDGHGVLTLPDGGPLHRCKNQQELIPLYRTDMYDQSGTLFCDHCAGDALTSGLFYAKETH